jgi:hypothetical protein
MEAQVQIVRLKGDWETASNMHKPGYNQVFLEKFRKCIFHPKMGEMKN